MCSLIALSAIVLLLLGREAETPKLPKSSAAKAITSFFRSLDREIREATDNELDLKVLLPLAAGVLGFLAFRRKAATPLWLTLMIFAFHSFLTLHGVAVTEEDDEFTIGATNGAPSK